MTALSGWLPQNRLANVLIPLTLSLCNHAPALNLVGVNLNKIQNGVMPALEATQSTSRILNSKPAQHALNQFMTQYRA